MSIQQWVTPLEGLDSLRQTDAPMASPGHGEVLVEVHAVSLNYRDVEGSSDLVEFFSDDLERSNC
jgi:NADPH:quinone reductase-like Zn-dependent oxidoreductase